MVWDLSCYFLISQPRVTSVNISCRHICVFHRQKIWNEYYFQQDFKFRKSWVFKNHLIFGVVSTNRKVLVVLSIFIHQCESWSHIIDLVPDTEQSWKLYTGWYLKMSSLKFAGKSLVTLRGMRSRFSFIIFTNWQRSSKQWLLYEKPNGLLKLYFMLHVPQRPELLGFMTFCRVRLNFVRCVWLHRR